MTDCLKDIELQEITPVYGFPSKKCYRLGEMLELNSVCTFCSGKARYSHRISEDNGVVVLGEKDKYVPLCRSCYNEMSDE